MVSPLPSIPGPFSSFCFPIYQDNISAYLQDPFHYAGEGKGEPAIEENLQEKASGTETTEPFIVDNGEDDMTTVTAFGVSWNCVIFYPG